MRAAWCSVICSALLTMAGCHRGEDAPATAAAAGHPAADAAENLGVETVAVKAIRRTAEVAGYGTVLSHEAIAQAVADLATAAAMERQSRAALARGGRLAGTAGAFPAETQESAERQATVDQAALDLARRRLSAIIGQNPPWQDRTDSAELTALASGRNKLLRATFPLGSLPAVLPKILYVAHFNVASGANAAPGAKRWEAHGVWRAPADASVPGDSVYTMLKSSELVEGERLLAWAPVGEAEEGVDVPQAAAVINAGKYWCFIEHAPGVFARVELDIGTATADGFFVRDGIAPGSQVVTQGAGQLLARELNPAQEAD